MRICASTVVPRCSWIVAADVDHPEIMLEGDLGDVDGSVLYVHPDEEERARDVIAQLEEQGLDAGQAMTQLRKAPR